MYIRKVYAVIGIVFALLLSVFAATKLRQAAIVNSTIDSSVIGGTTPSSATFTTATASSFVGPLTGNSSTATALASLGTQCSPTDHVVLGGVNQSGSVVGCGPSIRAGFLSSTCTTGSSSFSTCDTGFSWLTNFPNTNQVYATCSGSPSDGRAALLTTSPTQSGGTAHVTTNGSVGVFFSNVTCIGVQF